MGTATFIADPDAFSPIDSNSGWSVRGEMSLSATYLNGTGDTVTAAMLGLGTIKTILCESAGGYVFRYNDENTTIQAYWTGAGLSAVLAEVTNGTNLSAVPFEIIAYG